LVIEGVSVAYQDGVIFQRTESGRAEIHQSKILLRHHERLVLVVVDGVNTYAELRSKMRNIVRDKFDRALDGLKEKGLIVEILFPLIDQQKDAIDPEVLVDFLKVNSRLAPDTVGNGVMHSYDTGGNADQSFSGMISGNENIGLTVNTKSGFASHAGNPAYSPEDDVDFYLPMDVSLGDVAASARAKTKLVNIHPRPERKKRKKSKRPVVVQIGWHIYVYYGLLAVGVLLVLYSVFFRS
jgi:hypothetical protein